MILGVITKFTGWVYIQLTPETYQQNGDHLKSLIVSSTSQNCRSTNLIIQRNYFIIGTYKV